MLSEYKPESSVYEELFQTMHSAALILKSIDDGKDFVIMDLNNRLSFLIGVTREKLLGERFSQVLPNFSYLIPLLKRILKTGGGEYLPEIPYLSDGHLIWREFHIQRLTPRYVLMLFDDVTKRKTAEDRLKESEAKYRELFNNADDCIFLNQVNEDGSLGPLLEINKAACQRLGIDRAEALALLPDPMGIYNDIIHDPDKMEQLTSTGRLTFQTVYHDAHGKPVHFEVKSHVFTLMGRRVILSIARDISERIAAERLIRETEERYANLFNALHEGIVVLEIIEGKDGKNDYRVIEVNPSFLRAAGMKREDLIGRSIYDPEFAVEPEWLSAFDKSVRLGKPLQTGGWYGRLKKYFDAFIYLPEPGRVACLFVDMTERYLAEKELAREKELLEVTLSSIGEGVLATNNEGKIIFFNRVASELLDIPAHEAIGVELYDLFNMLQKKGAFDDLVGERPPIELSDSEITLSIKGQRKYLYNSAAPICDRHGKTSGLVMVFRDITEQVEAQRRIDYLRFHDKLTDVYNRDYVDKVLEEWDHPSCLPLTLILGDVNGLKLTNDVFGHQEGDRLLRQVASILVEVCGIRGIIARWGGDEFLILMPGTTYEEGVEICRQVKVRFDEAPADPIKVSMAIGLATRETMDMSIGQLFKEAEDLMYKNKLLENQESRRELIESVKRTLCLRSQETEAHINRLNSLFTQMASLVWLSQAEREQIKQLAALHDIGKISIPAAILNKPWELTPEEWELVKKHPENGYRIAQAVSEMAPVAEAILCHHEWWDGSGYPQGLSGSDIPVLSRMLAIVDAYDVMTHDQPYRSALTCEEALDEILNRAGTQFDPALARIFVNMIKRQDGGDNQLPP